MAQTSIHAAGQSKTNDSRYQTNMMLVLPCDLKGQIADAAYSQKLTVSEFMRRAAIQSLKTGEASR